MSQAKEPELQMRMAHKEEPPNEPPRKSEFKLPEGYSVGWRVRSEPGKKPVGGYVLRGPGDKELGFFKFKPGKDKLDDVLRAHLRSRVIGHARKSAMKALVLLVDSEGKEVCSWDTKKAPETPMSTMVKELDQNRGVY